MMDHTLRIKVSIININTAERTDKVKNVLFVERVSANRMLMKHCFCIS